jgi:hypothetical protein
MLKITDNKANVLNFIQLSFDDAPLAVRLASPRRDPAAHLEWLVAGVHCYLTSIGLAPASRA